MEKFYRWFVYFEDTVTYFDKIVMFSHRGKQIDILKFIQLKLFLSEVLTLFDIGCFEPSVMGEGGHEGPHHKFVVIVPMIMKFGTDIKLDVFYTMVTKRL